MNKDIFEKFRETVSQFSMIAPGDRVLVAYSGGADSTALLHLLLTLRAEVPFEIAVAHFNHRLRAAADSDEAFARETAGRLGLPFIAGRRDVKAYARRRSLNLEEAARTLRYEFLVSAAGRTGSSKIATGHTLNDQAETFLIRLLRGSGPRGLAGIHPVVKGRAFAAEVKGRASGSPLARGLYPWTSTAEVDPQLKAGALTRYVNTRLSAAEAGPQTKPGAPAAVEGKIIRPLLGLPRAEILGLCRRSKLNFRRDESNRDPRFLRNKIRRGLLPYLEKAYEPAVVSRLGRLASILRDEEIYLDGVTRKAYERLRVGEKHKLALDARRLGRLPRALARRCVRAYLADIKGDLRKMTFDDVEAVLGLGEKQVVTLSAGIRMRRDGDRIGMATGPRSKSAYFRSWDGTSVLQVAEAGMAFRGVRLKNTRDANRTFDDSSRIYCDAAKVRFPLLVRSRRDGDRYWPFGAPGSKKLKEILRAKGIPLSERNIRPVFCSGGSILWVPGLPVAEEFKVTDRTRTVFCLEMKTI